MQEIMQCVFDGESRAVPELVMRALREGLVAEDVLSKALIPAMEDMGAEFECGLMFLPDMLASAHAMKAAVAILEPHFRDASVPSIGRVVVATVAGDIHDIGKNLFSMMLSGAGFQVIDLGTDAAPEKFVAAVATHRPDIVGMSALLTTTMPMMKVTLEALRAAGYRQAVTVIVGGAPISAAYAADIGADLYARDAAAGARLCRALVIAKNLAAGQAGGS